MRTSKETGQFEDIFMQKVPAVVHYRVPKLHVTDPKTHVSCEKTIMNRKGEKGIILPLLSRVRILAAGILYAVTNKTESQLTMYHHNHIKQPYKR